MYIRWKSAEGSWKSSLLQKITILWDDGMVKSPERWQRAVEENDDDVVQSRCWGEMKSVPVIASRGKKQRILSAKPFQVLVSAATSWSFRVTTP